MTPEDFGKRWQDAQGRARGEIIAQMMQAFAWSKQTCYRKLSELGYKSGRKRREDAGVSAVSAENLLVLASMLREGLRDSGKEQLKIPEARSIMAMNGYEVEVSNRQLSRLLQEPEWNMKKLKQPKPHAHLRSLYPNHVWQIDPSYCTMYYLRSGRQVILDNKELYKNKHEMYEKLAKAKLKIWRYVCVDHYSGCIFTHYFNARGENQENLFEFFLSACSKKKDNPLHGVPEFLMMDKGSANTAKAMIVALSSLGVRVLTHQAGNSRTKGAVEKANDIVETTFEIRLKFEPLHSIEELNIACSAYFIAFNANAVPHRNSQINRPGGCFVRETLWLQIAVKQLRLLPDMALCRRLLVEPAQERQVQADMCISYMQHPFAKSKGLQGGLYSVGHLPVSVGQKVLVQALAFDGAAILLRYQTPEGREETAQIAEPLAVDGAGRLATSAVIGAQFEAVADDRQEKLRKQFEQLAHPQGKKPKATPFAHVNAGKGLQSHNQMIAAVHQHRREVKTIPKQGSPVNLGTVQIYEPEYSLPEALSKLRAMLEAEGRGYSKDYVALVQNALKRDKIPQGKLEELFRCITEANNECFYKQA
ncbi:transposase family protein [Candidatus Haliotispira prima]|uniref:Transposase family protein n=1 Tax=Candidatus Haliotispira prima TaxID=3034016 RepID=A0ABY8MHG3_9SPIO|nr:transposase family protein [Candidatus Haliotispira prima]